MCFNLCQEVHSSNNVKNFFTMWKGFSFGGGVPPALSRVWQHVKLSDVSLETCPRYSLVVDEDFKKPNNLSIKRFSLFN